MSIEHIVPPRYCVECGRVKTIMAFMNEDWCSENCRKSISGEGPKVGLSQECIDRNIASGQFIEFDPKLMEQHLEQYMNFETVGIDPELVGDILVEPEPKKSLKGVSAKFLFEDESVLTEQPQNTLPGRAVRKQLKKAAKKRAKIDIQEGFGG